MDVSGKALTCLIPTLLALTACGSGSNQSSTTVTVTTTVRETPTTPPAAEPGSAVSTPTTGDSTKTSGDLSPEAAGRRLTLADFFEPDSTWSENRFDIADKGQVQGLGHVTNSCTPNSSLTLELRLRNVFSSLSFKVGQANNSKGSDQILMVEVMANGSQKEIRRVGFNSVQPLTISTAGVNALQIRFFLDQSVKGCGYNSVTVVLFDAQLTS